MNEYDIKRLGLILSIQADIDAAKLDNEIRKSQGLDTFNFDSEYFFHKAAELQNAVYSHNEQLF